MQQEFNTIQREMADSLWLAMKGESLFITGGSGLFGYWFLSSLIDANKRLGTAIKATVLSRTPETFKTTSPELFKDNWVELIKGNVIDFTFPIAKYDRILHLAVTSAQETFQGEDQLAKFKMLVTGTERVLQFAASCEAEKVLFTSSGVVYGSCPENMTTIPESYPGSPNSIDIASAVGQGKRAAEFLCSYYANKYQFDFTIARCFSVIGPKIPLDLHYAIGNFIRDALTADKIIVKGNGTSLRSYLYMADLIVWLQKLLINAPPRQFYNVGSDRGISIKELAYLIRDLLCPEKEVVIEGDCNHAIGNFNRNCYVPDITRAKQELNLAVWTSLEQAILYTTQYAKTYLLVSR